MALGGRVEEECIEEMNIACNPENFVHTTQSCLPPYNHFLKDTAGKKTYKDTIITSRYKYRQANVHYHIAHTIINITCIVYPYINVE